MYFLNTMWCFVSSDGILGSSDHLMKGCTCLNFILYQTIKFHRKYQYFINYIPSWLVITGILNLFSLTPNYNNFLQYSLNNQLSFDAQQNTFIFKLLHLRVHWISRSYFYNLEIVKHIGFKNYRKFLYFAK